MQLSNSILKCDSKCPLVRKDVTDIFNPLALLNTSEKEINFLKSKMQSFRKQMDLSRTRRSHVVQKPVNFWLC